MDNDQEQAIKLEMDIADFSSKTVKRIDIQNLTGRSSLHETGMAVVMSFTDGSTGTILIRSGHLPIVASPYARPRMAEFAIEEETEGAEGTLGSLSQAPGLGGLR